MTRSQNLIATRKKGALQAKNGNLCRPFTRPDADVTMAIGLWCSRFSTQKWTNTHVKKQLIARQGTRPATFSTSDRILRSRSPASASPTERRTLYATRFPLTRRLLFHKPTVPEAAVFELAFVFAVILLLLLSASAAHQQKTVRNLCRCCDPRKSKKHCAARIVH